MNNSNNNNNYYYYYHYCLPHIELFLVAEPGKDFSFKPGTKFNFFDVETPSSLSFAPLVVPIINDDIAEPCESFICTLQGGALDAVRGIEPNRVTIRICDDDCEHMHACYDS